MAASTDAANDYFDRPDDPGRIVISSPAASKFSVRPHLRNGRIVFFLEPIDTELVLGEEVSCQIALVNSGNAHLDASDSCSIVIVPAETKEKPQPKPGRSPKPVTDSSQDGKSGTGESTAPTLAMPSFKFLTHDGRPIGDQDTDKWPAEYTEMDGGHVKDLGEGRLKFFINYDNHYHIAAKQRQQGDIAKKAVSEKYKWGMLILMLSFEQAYRSLAADNDTGLGEHHDDFRRIAARGAASTVLTVAEVLPKILNTAELDTE